MRLEAKTACVFLCQITTPDTRMKPRYTDAFWGEHPFDGYMILIKNKNKNKNMLWAEERQHIVREPTVGVSRPPVGPGEMRMELQRQGDVKSW